MTTTRRPALPNKATHPMEDLIAPEAPPVPPASTSETTFQRPPLTQSGHLLASSSAPSAGEVQLNVRINGEVSRAFDQALLQLSAARGQKVTKKAAIEEAIHLLFREHQL